MKRLALVACLLVAACARGEMILPEAPPVDRLTVNASTGWAYIDLSSGETVVPANATTSTAWDIGFSATTVALNGGASGSAGVIGYCLCQNAAATNEQILAFTEDSEAASFTVLTSADIPATSAEWTSDVFATKKWYRYNLQGDNRISPTFDIYFVKRGTSVYKVQLIGYYGPAGETRRITVRYAKLS